MLAAGQVTATSRAMPATGANASKAGGADFGDVMEGFLREARMTPAQRIRRDVLKDNRLTEDTLAAMTPAERKVIEDKIAPIIKQRVKIAEEEAQRRGKAVGLPSL